MLEVVGLLLPADVDARVAGRVVDQLGPPAPRLLRDDPWRLLAVPGVTPADADRLARSVIPGVTRDDPRRARALVGWVLGRQARDGHTVGVAEEVAAELEGFGAGDPAAALEAAVESAAVVASEDGMVGLARYAEAEDGVAQGIARLLATAEAVEATGAVDDSLDATQQAAVAAALSGGVTVLTGGPGTGKSRTVAALVSLAETAGRTVALAAPTGRAAKRLEELCDAPARTLHRLLGAQPRQSGDAVSFDGGFARGEEWPLDEDLVVVDEASMLDVELADALLTACADGTHLVLVGDAAQLPSIGPGRVLARHHRLRRRPRDRADHAVPAGRGRDDRAAGHRGARRASCRRSTTRPARWSWCRRAAPPRPRTASPSWSPTRSRGRCRSRRPRCRW